MSETAAGPGRTHNHRIVACGTLLILVTALAAWVDFRSGWLAPGFDLVARQFYEVPSLAAIRRPSQVALVRVHLLITAGLAAVGLLVSPVLGRHGRRFWAVLVVGYVLRAIAWIAGGNLPMVSGDSPHYVEVAASILRGEGPVKHYVESFFIDYRAIREGKGVLDDWATPLYPYVLAAAYRLTGVVPGESLESTVAVDKGVSFALNLLCLPALYGLARRHVGRETALGAMAVLAVLPVHVIYAGLDLRESLVALTSILAVWCLTEMLAAKGPWAWAWAIVGGVSGGAAILARNTGMALLAASALFAIVAHRRKTGLIAVWGFVVLVVIGPWAWATYQAYGRPFYSYTDFFQYTFSWTVHHYQAGVPRGADFYARQNLPEIARVKIKALFIIVGYSTMILSLPLMLAFWRRVLSRGRTDLDRLVAVITLVFVASTLLRIADVTQVAQLGRYYLPIFCLMLPTACAGLADWWRERQMSCRRGSHWRSRSSRSSGPTRPGPTTRPGSRSRINYTGRPSARRETGSRPIPTSSPPTRGSWRGSRGNSVWPAAGRRSFSRASFSAARIDEVVRQYRVTHVLWGSFEPPPNVDPETFGPYLSGVRTSLGLTDSREVYRSPREMPFGVRLYRLSGSAR